MATSAFCANKDKEAQKYVDRGMARLAKHDNGGAITDFTKALQLNPGLSLVYINRGVARMGKRDFDNEGAIADFTEAIRQCTEASRRYTEAPLSATLAPNSTVSNSDVLGTLAAFEVLAYYNRAIAMEQKGDMDGIIADFTKAIELRGAALRTPRDDLRTLVAALDCARAYRERGNARATKHDLIGAIADYTAAIELDPADADSYYNRGSAKGNSGDGNGARADHSKAFQLKPDLPYPR
jgi:tetratricopeptide (TPR) repeat protein